MRKLHRRFSLLLVMGSSALFPEPASAAPPPGGYVDFCKTQAADGEWIALDTGR